MSIARLINLLSFVTYLEYIFNHAGGLGSAAQIGDSFGHAARLAGAVMIASNSIGVNRPQCGLAPPAMVDALDPGDDRDA